MNLLITGATGFVGTNFCKHYRQVSDVDLLLANSATPRNVLREFVKRSDVIMHFAAAQRPADGSEFNIVNVGLTEFIVENMC
ncbi:MAG: NAD-dependent epimerase/dehydratase family protein, partial [Bacteroides sp.]|nr:NAD-dependent epimerase/dehydratase family protein [Bacteroides sp.]